ncbi:11568_t:CDS:2 [Ambispora gerdemannii]|uniref:11568_t:CDS:1 n=1 Tax=Ambispora gerdemannii TaxID=144530 RepID=A0A9N9B520_9GLOM|nr:11568_t:CDS:2 [Ambispora gerdemannii]
MTDRAQSHDKDSGNNAATKSAAKSTATIHTSINSLLTTTTTDDSDISDQEYDNKSITTPLLVQEQGIEVNIDNGTKNFSQATLGLLNHPYQETKAWFRRRFIFDDQFLTDYALAFVMWFTLPFLVVLVCTWDLIRYNQWTNYRSIFSGPDIIVPVCHSSKLYYHMPYYLDTQVIYNIDDEENDDDEDSTNNNVDSEQQQVTTNTNTNSANNENTDNSIMIIDGAES